jgi:hypothetical protein
MRLGGLALVVAALATTVVFDLLLRDAVRAVRSPSAYAAPHPTDPSGRIYQNGNNNDNGEDGDNDDQGNEDGDNDNEDDFDVDIGLDLPPPSSSIAQPDPVCSTPGQDTVFTSFDRKVTVRVPGSSPRPVRVGFYLVVNAHEAPSPPGAFVHPLVYELRASYCDADPLAASPVEVDLAIRYTDVEATGPDEGRFVIGRLNTTTAAWVSLGQRANDPAANVIAATIIETVFYMVWEAR